MSELLFIFSLLDLIKLRIYLENITYRHTAIRDMHAINPKEILRSSVCLPPVINVRSIAEGKNVHAENVWNSLFLLIASRLTDKEGELSIQLPINDCNVSDRLNMYTASATKGLPDNNTDNRSRTIRILYYIWCM